MGPEAAAQRRAADEMPTAATWYDTHARELLCDAAAVPVVSRVQEYGLEEANEALLDLKEDRVRGSAVLHVA